MVALCSSVAATASFGQATIVWNGGDGTGTAIGAATNWVGGVSPNSAAGDICQWDGTVPGNLFLTSASPNGNFNNGTPGVSFLHCSGSYRFVEPPFSNCWGVCKYRPERYDD